MLQAEATRTSSSAQQSLALCGRGAEWRHLEPHDCAAMSHCTRTTVQKRTTAHGTCSACQARDGPGVCCTCNEELVVALKAMPPRVPHVERLVLGRAQQLPEDVDAAPLPPRRGNVARVFRLSGLDALLLRQPRRSLLRGELHPRRNGEWARGTSIFGRTASDEGHENNNNNIVTLYYCNIKNYIIMLQYYNIIIL